MKGKRFKRLGVALGGGAALGAAHIGVLKALKELDIKPDYISGTSIGAFVAAHIAFGTSVEELEEISTELDWLDVSAFKLSRMGLLSNERLGKSVLDRLGRVNIEDAQIPLSMIATNISTGEKVVLKEGPLYKAVMASTCLPGIFVPVEWDGELLVDGVLCENVPVSPLREMGAKDIIAVDLTTNRKYKRPKDLVDVLLNTFDIGLNNMIREQIEDKATTWIQPELGAYNMADTGKAEKLIQEGYKTAMKILSKDDE
jgi:NTE family protein